jgi:hypothetical protein
MNRYGDKESPDKAYFLEAWNGVMYLVQRIKRGTLMIENNALSILGGIQPDKLSTQVTQNVEDGFLPRFLLTILNPMSKGDNSICNKATTQAFNKIVNILSLLPSMDLTFTDEAQSKYDLRSDQYRQLAENTEVESIAYHIRKFPILLARLAATFHLIEWASKTPSDLCFDFDMPPFKIEVESVIQSIEFMKVELEHATEFLNNLDGMNVTARLTKQVAEYIATKRHTTVTRRNIVKGVSEWSKEGRNIQEDVVNRLIDSGWLIGDKSKRTHGGRRNSSTAGGSAWDVNPEVFDKFDHNFDIASKIKRKEALILAMRDV